MDRGESYGSSAAGWGGFESFWRFGVVCSRVVFCAIGEGRLFFEIVVEFSGAARNLLYFLYLFAKKSICQSWFVSTLRQTVPISGYCLISSRPAFLPLLAAAKAFSHCFSSNFNLFDAFSISEACGVSGIDIVSPTNPENRSLQVPRRR